MKTLEGKVPADTLGARLELLRRELGWSQRKAAEITGVPFGTWQGMESGRETRGLDRHVAAIVATTGYDRDWLMWGGPLSPLPPGGNNDRYPVAA
jgi:transcriptional regulator with XRE-family HTH domain